MDSNHHQRELQSKWVPDHAHIIDSVKKLPFCGQTNHTGPCSHKRTVFELNEPNPGFNRMPLPRRPTAHKFHKGSPSCSNIETTRFKPFHRTTGAHRSETARFKPFHRTTGAHRSETARSKPFHRTTGVHRSETARSKPFHRTTGAHRSETARFKATPTGLEPVSPD